MLTYIIIVVSENQLKIDPVIIVINMCYRVDHFLSNLNILYGLKSVGM